MPTTMELAIYAIPAKTPMATASEIPDQIWLAVFKILLAMDLTTALINQIQTNWIQTKTASEISVIPVLTTMLMLAIRVMPMKTVSKMATIIAQDTLIRFNSILIKTAWAMPATHVLMTILML